MNRSVFRRQRRDKPNFPAIYKATHYWVFIKLFEYNSDYWSADYAQPDQDGPRCKTFSTPANENSTTQRNGGEGLINSTEIHHVRAVFDFTDLAEPWPNN